MKSTTPRPTTEWLPVSSLTTDPTVNTRPLKPAKVAEIAANFDPAAFRFIEVSERAAGEVVILDGQHRVSALRKMGWDNGQMVECKVHRGLTHERECRLFDELNDQLKMSALVRMLARIGAEVEPDVSINAIAESLGLTIGEQKIDGQLCSANALYKVYGGGRFVRTGVGGAANSRINDNPHPELLRRTLRLILSSWGKQKDGLRGDIIMGTGAFLARRGDLVDDGALVTRLAQLQGGPLALLADGRSLAHLHNSQVEYGIAGKLTFIYNERRRAGKLADWWAG